jgi:translation initiation factor 1
MSENCPVCGLPKELCVCSDIAKEKQQIVVKVVKRKFGNSITVVEGIEGTDLKIIAKQLKEKFACGGTVKNNTIELQGDHRKNMKEILVQMGFAADSIEVKQQIG